MAHFLFDPGWPYKPHTKILNQIANFLFDAKWAVVWSNIVSVLNGHHNHKKYAQLNYEYAHKYKMGSNLAHTVVYPGWLSK